MSLTRLFDEINKALISSSGVPFTNEEIKEIWDDADTDSNSRISLSEFLKANGNKHLV